MPKPKKNEAKTDYLKRCTKDLVEKEGKKATEAYAICNSYWDREKGEASLMLSAPVDMTLEDKDSGRRSFLITAKTKNPLSFWGKTVHIDVDGIATDAKLPILREHNRQSIVGHGSAFKADYTLYIEGEFSRSTQTAKEVLALADEGYPWQASIGMWAEKVEYLEDEKARATVNGMDVKGPAVIVRESRVREVSFVTLGADDKTAAISLSDSECCGEILKEEEDIMNAEELKEKYPDLAKEIEDAAFSRGYDDGRKDGVNAERSRVVEILEAEADPGTTREAIEKGTDAAEAYKAFFMAEKQKRADALKQMAEEATPPVGQEEPKAPESKAASPDQVLAEKASELAAKENISYKDASRRIMAADAALRKRFAGLYGRPTVH